MSVALIPFSEVQAMAQAAAKSRLFGCDSLEQAFSLMLLAQAKGLHPMLAVERYHIIQGRPAMKAETMLAEFLRGGGKVKWLQRDDKVCEAEFSHPDGGTVTVKWTLEMAQKACNNKAMYDKYPRQMLHARTVSEGVRAVYPDAVLGAYTPEEISDFEPKYQVVETTIQPDEPDQRPAIVAKILEAKDIMGDEWKEIMARKLPGRKISMLPNETEEKLREALQEITDKFADMVVDVEEIKIEQAEREGLQIETTESEEA